MGVVRHHAGREQLIALVVKMAQRVENDGASFWRKAAAGAGGEGDGVNGPRLLEMGKVAFRVFGISDQADVGGSSRRRDAFANTRDARAPRSSLPGALDDRERLPHVFGDAEFSTVLSGRRILLAH